MDLLNGCHIGLLWGYYGVMAKSGPLAGSEVCAVLRGLLDRLLTHFCLLVEGAAVLVGAVGATCVVSTVAVDGVVVKFWHGCCESHLLYFWVSIHKIVTAKTKVMRVSIAFKNQTFELIDVFSFNFVMPVFLDFIDKTYALDDVIF